MSSRAGYAHSFDSTDGTEWRSFPYLYVLKCAVHFFLVLPASFLLDAILVTGRSAL